MYEPFKPFYQFSSPTRVIAGEDLIESAGFEFRKEGARRALLVTDSVIRATGLPERVEAGLIDGGVECAGTFDQVPQDSDTDAVASCAALASELGADSFIAVGGGSVIDTAKAANVIFTHGGSVREWEGFYLLPRADDGLGRPLPLAPLAAIPTTAGTGAEASFAAVVKDRADGLKVEIADFPVYPSLAILDPEATATLPPLIAAATGFDALTHAVEGYVSTDWSPHGDAFALHAVRMIGENLERAVAEPGDVAARGAMLVAACMAIQPMGSGALGIAHSMSHPCGGLFGVPHGVANSINLPIVVEFNSSGSDPAVGERYRRLGSALGLTLGGSPKVAGAALAVELRRMTERLGLPRRLGELGVPRQAIPALATAAVGDACTIVNPRETSEEDFAELFGRAI